MLKEIGYLPRCLDLSTGGLSINTLPCLTTKIGAVERDPLRKGDWIHAPPDHRIFCLPKTHQINHSAPQNDQHAEFLIWCLGFLVGMRLTATEAGFLDATPCKTGKLVDFLCWGKNLERALGQADRFFCASQPGPAPGLAVSAIHALFVAQGPRLLCYERLLYLYTALDACYLAASSISKPRIEHAQRVVAKCLGEKDKKARDINAWRAQVTAMALGCPTPHWAICQKVNDKKQSDLSAIRNAMIHEGLVDGEPLGFRIIESFDGSPNPGGNPLLEVENFLCRLLIAILGIDAPAYIRSPVGTRMPFLLEVGS